MGNCFSLCVDEIGIETIEEINERLDFLEERILRLERIEKEKNISKDKKNARIGEWVKFNKKFPPSDKTKYILYQKKVGHLYSLEAYYRPDPDQFENATHWIEIPPIPEEDKNEQVD